MSAIIFLLVAYSKFLRSGGNSGLVARIQRYRGGHFLIRTRNTYDSLWL